VDQSWLITSLIWLLVGLGALAVALGVMVFAARRMEAAGYGDDDDDDAHLAQQPARPPRGGKTTPLKVTAPEFRPLRLADFHNDSRVLRDFGELVTVAALAADGWKKLPSRLQGGQGLDVLFVRDVKGLGGFEARAIEVKTNDTAYNPQTMSDERVAAALGRLHDIGAFDAATLEELLRGLWQGPPYFRKEVWRHQLDSGETTIFELDEAGNKMSAQPRPSAHLMDALFQMIKQFDRNAGYVDRPVVEAPPEEVVHAAVRRPKRGPHPLLKAYTRTFAFRPKRPADRFRVK